MLLAQLLYAFIANAYQLDQVICLLCTQEVVVPAAAQQQHCQHY
jgi:hypothetical protein